MFKIHLPLTLICLLLLLVACGNDTDDDENNSAGSQVEASSYPDELVKEGQANFGIYCFACHGANATGVTGLGPNLLENKFVNNHSDEEILAFVKEGRPANHPDNQTGIAMPAKGGFPNLTDDAIHSMIAWVRTQAAK